MFIIKFHEGEESSSVILRRINNYEWTKATIQVAGYIYIRFKYKNITYKREMKKIKKKNNNRILSRKRN